MWCRQAAVIALGSLLVGCSSLSLPGDRTERMQRHGGVVCDSAVGSATTGRAAVARDYAREAALVQVGEVRGDLLAAGLRGTRLAGETTTCGPYALAGAGGLVTCTTAVKVCAH